MVIEPDAKREQAHISIEIKTTLCPAQLELTTIIIGVDKDSVQTAKELKSGIKGQTFIDNDVKDGPRAAIFEADGGAWKLAAVRNIKKYLEEKLKEQVESGRIIIIA